MDKKETKPQAPDKDLQKSVEYKIDSGLHDIAPEEDFYMENGFVVFTRKYHLQRGFCCKSGCRHCPY